MADEAASGKLIHERISWHVLSQPGILALFRGGLTSDEEEPRKMRFLKTPLTRLTSRAKIVRASKGDPDGESA